MGTQQIFRAAAALVAIASSAGAAPRSRERVAVIDLGPTDDSVRQKVAAAIANGGLEPVIGDGVEDALAGVSRDRDAIAVAAALERAKQAFGALDCKAASTAAMTAVGIASARQAAGLAVPELPRAWSYVLLCADRAGDTDAALTAAAQLRALGGAPEVDASVLARYPEVDVLAGRDMLDVDIKAEVDGAEVFVDGNRAGKSPLHLLLPAGQHVIAAASGTKRGYATGTVVKTQPVIALPLPDQAGPWSQLAARVAAWHGKQPSPDELGSVLGLVHARVAILRRGTTLEAWGRIGPSQAAHLLGGNDGKRALADVDALIGLIAERVRAWNDHAPDPDQPLLVESPRDRFSRTDKVEQPAQWWVYAVIGGAIAASAIVIYTHESQSDMQRVELHYP